MPSVFRHTTKQAAINVHVDDILVAVKDPRDGEWLLQALRAKYKLQVEGPVPLGSVGAGEEIGYLKKKYKFTPEGIFVKPNEKYFDALIKLYNVEHKRPKATPDHQLLGQVDCSESLEDVDPERRKSFRSGLGTLMYIAQERIDCQFAIKSLASWLSAPTVNAEHCLIHLILYLKGTRNLTFLMGYEASGSSMTWKLNNVSGEGEQENNDRTHLFEPFTDSDWAGGAHSRKSTSSGILCLNSVVVRSHSRTQKSIALSSCEAELLALTGGLSETLLVKQIGSS